MQESAALSARFVIDLPRIHVLRRQSLLLADWLRSAQFHWDQPPTSMDRLQADLSEPHDSAQLHCQLVASLAAGEDSAAANKFNLPQSPTPPAPNPPQGSSDPTGQPLAFD